MDLFSSDSRSFTDYQQVVVYEALQTQDLKRLTVPPFAKIAMAGSAARDKLYSTTILTRTKLYLLMLGC
jgi:hypothetical protein